MKCRWRIAVVFAATLCGSLAPRVAWAQTSSTVEPLGDAYVSSANPANNYGGAGALSVAASATAKGEFVSLLRFDLASTKALFDATYGAGNWTITGASLQLTATNPNNPLYNNPSVAGAIAATWQANDSWVEGSGGPSAPMTTGVTYATLASFMSGGDEPTGSFAFSGATSGPVAGSLTVGGGFAADLAAGGSVSLRLSAANTTVAGVFNSRNFPTASSRPILVVTAVPEPGSGVCLFAFLCAQIRRGRR